MKKLSLIIILCLLFAALLVACENGGEQDTHTHTYSDAWSYNADSHWYAATCEHEAEKANVAAHADAENDGVCDVCGYGSDHTHAFAEDWSTDDASHWHASTCGHDVKDALGAHADADNDDVCDTCGHSGGCEHPVAADAWQSDAEGHWHGATCSHSVKLDAAAHADGDNDGICDICAWSDPAHTHTYKTEYAYDDVNHWFDADCGHSVKGEVGAHADANNDGACDTCPWNDGCVHEYSALWSVDGTCHWRDVICTHSIAPADKAEHSDVDGDGACDACGYLDHEHTYDTENWSSDASGHWHAATCGCSLKADGAAHTDEDNDGTCEICLWSDGCLHPVDDAWTYSDTHHWHGVICTHTVEPTDKAEHVDRDVDGTCDACGYCDPEHTHTYADTLTAGADTHFYAAACEHWGARKDEQKHTDENGDGKCDVCGGTASLQLVIDKITSDASAGKVNGGSVFNSSIYHFDDSDEPYYSVESITYEFGDGYLHTNDGLYDRWFTLLDDGTVFAARMIDGQYESEEASADNMAGYYFNGSFLYYNVNAYGVEALLYNLYAFALENASELRGIYDSETGIYGFTFSYDNGFGSLYLVQVYFVYDADFVLTEMVISSEVYSEFAQNEQGKYYVAADATPDYEYQLGVEQTVGARTAINEHGPENFLYDSYDFADELGTVYGDTILLAPGEAVYLYFANANPATATAKLDSFNVTTDAKSSQMYTYLAWSGDYVYVKGIAAGTYTLTVTSSKVEKVITIVVDTPELKGLTPMVYYKDHSGLYSTTVGTTYTLYAGQTLYFGAMANPTASDAGFSATADGGTLGSATITYGSEKVSVSTFTAAEGTYTITLTSTDNAAVTTTLIVQVLPKPGVGDILNGSYMASIFDYNYSSYSAADILVTFAPASAGATSGTVTVVRDEQTEVLSYRFEGGEIVLEHVSGDVLGYTLLLNDQYSVTIGWSYNDAQREQIMQEYNFTNRIIARTWVSENDMINGDVYLYTFVFGDGGYVYDGENGTYPDMLSQVDNESGAITVTFLDDVSGTALADIQSMTFDPDANSITLLLSDQTITLTPYVGW